VSRSFDRLVDAGYAGRTAAEIAAAPLDALRGVSPGDAAKLAEAFAIHEVGDLAASRFVRASGAVLTAASGRPGYDPGPPPDWEARFAAAPLDAYLTRPDVFRVDFGPAYYRGRLDGTARLLVVGQDPSVNEVLAHRAFVGKSGQRLQGLLLKMGLTRSYVMLNTFLFGIFGQFEGDAAAMSRTGPLLAYRNGLFDAVAADNPLEAVLTVGSAAKDAISRWPGRGELPTVHVLHPAFPDVAQLLADWNEALVGLAGDVEADDGAVPGPPYGTDFAPGDVVAIPRHDLPFGLPPWHGDGDHAVRAGVAVIEWRSAPVE
jgi:hypothetical protein